MRKKKTLMVSQPMRNIEDKIIRRSRERAIDYAKENGYLFINTLFDDAAKAKATKNPPIYYLGDTIRFMADCDVVYFARGWEMARGCRVEHEVAKQYGLEIVHEDELVCE